MTLCIDNISHRYGQTYALRDLSFEMERGVVGLVGSNGAGKSTLLRILATVVRPGQGGLWWRGRDVLASPDLLRRELGYLPQDFTTYAQLTGREFLHYIGTLKGLASRGLRARVAWALHTVGMEGSADRPLRMCSGGMRQRIGIAQALLNDPGLLILDEPTAGLDPTERTRFRNMLTALSADRLIIVSTHIMSDIEAIANTVMVLKGGRLLAAETPARLLQRVAGRVWDVSLPDQAPAPAGVIVSSARQPDNIHLRLVSEHVTRQGWPGATPLAPSLEDAYAWITRA